MATPTHQVGVKVPLLLHEKLAEHAATLNVSKSEVVLSALAQYLDSATDVPMAVRMAMLENRVSEIEALVKPEQDGDD
ncbi:CopG family transcriptional regulator [Crocosphaera sp. Alani8]|uniref:CopG family transcriptional regulator n=1 Tax=Crocosphaera sp. Alani8 TaxID=3038952 RepID=UPI00313AFA8B